ncbi:unnamed protein product [Lota lota]
MTLRGTSVPLRRSPSWRRSGDDSHWESLVSGGGGPRRTARPLSVSAERGHTDYWLRDPERTQSGPLRDPPPDHRDPGLPLNRPTATMPTLHNKKGPPTTQPGSPGPAGTPASYRWEDFPSSGTPSVCDSSRGSPDPLLLTACGAPAERRGSWERARMVQMPATEKTRVSGLAPVRIGWLPVQRRVSGLGGPQGQTPREDNTASAQMKMKQPITPIIQTAPFNGFRHLDGEVEQREVGPCGLRAETRCWPETSAGSPFQQVSNKISVATEDRGALTWQSLRRGWGLNKISAPSGGSKVSSRSHGADVQTPPTPPPEVWRLHPPLRGTSSTQPAGSTAFPAATDSTSRPSPGETGSAATAAATTSAALVPHDKLSFSSITISSKKVTRATGLPPGNYNYNNNDNNNDNVSPSGYPGQPPPRPGASPPPNAVTLRRKATIVKVTEQRMTSAPSPSATPAQRSSPDPDHVAPGDGPGGLGDTVVRRRKATVIKVTEHRESYGAAVAHGDRRPYRHSYTEGVYTEDSVWREGPQGPQGPRDPPEHNPVAPTRYVEPPQRALCQRGPPEDRALHRALHRSTLSLVLSNGGGEPPGVARPRPASCYGNVFGHTEAARGGVETKPCLARKLSCGILPQEAGNIPSQPSSGAGAGGDGVGGGGGLLCSTGVPEPNGDGKEGGVHVAPRRSSLVLLKPPDAGSQQSARDILGLNAAAVIANIKLQRQLSKKRTQDGRPAKDASASSPHQGNEEGVVGKVEKSNPGQKRVHGVSPDPASAPSPQQPGPSLSLQEALERCRPSFIARSRDRVRALQRRTQERRRTKLSGQRRSQRPPLDPSLNDNLFRRRDRAITGRDEDPRSRHSPAGLSEGKRSRKEDTKREACLANRQRVELFKKRLLDHILHRNNL